MNCHLISVVCHLWCRDILFIRHKCVCLSTFFLCGVFLPLNFFFFITSIEYKFERASFIANVIFILLLRIRLFFGLVWLYVWFFSVFPFFIFDINFFFFRKMRFTYHWCLQIKWPFVTCICWLFTSDNRFDSCTLLCAYESQYLYLPFTRMYHKRKHTHLRITSSHSILRNFNQDG